MDTVIKNDDRKIRVKHKDGTELNYYKTEIIEQEVELILAGIKGRIQIHADYPEEYQEFCSAFSSNNKEAEFMLADACNKNQTIKDYFKQLYGVDDVHFVCTGNNNGPDALLCNGDYTKVLTKLEFKVRHAAVETSKNGNYRNQKDEMSYALKGTYKFHATEKNDNENAGEEIIKRNQDMILVCAMFNPIIHKKIVGDIFVVKELKELLTTIFENSNSKAPKIGLTVSTLYPGAKYSYLVSAVSFSDELSNEFVINAYLAEVAVRSAKDEAEKLIIAELPSWVA